MLKSAGSAQIRSSRTCGLENVFTFRLSGDSNGLLSGNDHLLRGLGCSW